MRGNRESEGTVIECVGFCFRDVRGRAVIAAGTRVVSINRGRLLGGMAITWEVLNGGRGRLECEPIRAHTGHGRQRYRERD